jgi:hypothetical protein
MSEAILPIYLHDVDMENCIFYVKQRGELEAGDGVGHCIVQLLVLCSLELIHTRVSSDLTKKRACFM